MLLKIGLYLYQARTFASQLICDIVSLYSTVVDQYFVLVLDFTVKSAKSLPRVRFLSRAD